MFPEEIDALARQVLDRARAGGLTIALAESCTGGLLAGALTDIAGSSDVVDRGLVVYSNAAKHELLGVPEGLLAAHGAVSEPVARAMASGALAASSASLAVSVTGIAGPGGASPGKPVGLVHFGLAQRGRPGLHREARFGDLGRRAVRLAAVAAALQMLLEAIGDQGAYDI